MKKPLRGEENEIKVNKVQFKFDFLSIEWPNETFELF